MLKTVARAAALLFVLAASSPALDITTNLRHAKTGSWIRRFALRNHVYTEHVVNADHNAVTLQLLRHHDGNLLENKVVVIPLDYIARHGIDPDGPQAKSASISHKEKTFHTKVVRVTEGGSQWDLYITREIPASGIIRKDILHGKNTTEHWTDAWGDTPDEMITRAGDGMDANAEFGIPKP